MVSWGRVKRRGTNPRWWVEEAFPAGVKKFYKHFIFKPYYTNFDVGYRDIMDETWDNLIILDACRYDIFEKLNYISGKLSKTISQGSSSGEFLKENFKNKKYNDTVYVSGNPHTHEYRDVFYNVVPVWQTHWDDELGTVTPESMAEATKEAHREYPNKRIISHFMQPHQPYIGEVALDQLGVLSGNTAAKVIAEDGISELDIDRDEMTHVFELLKSGDVSRERVWEYYRENLEVVLPHVRELVSYFPEHTVVTSDHGEMFGEIAWPVPMRAYAHPTELHARPLVEVPWLEINTGTRKRVISEDPVSEQNDVSQDIEERLASLGYTGR